MKIYITLIYLCLISLSSCQPIKSELNVDNDHSPLVNKEIVPIPMQMDLKEGNFTINSNTQIVIMSSELNPIAQILAEHLQRLTGIRPSISSTGPDINTIVLEIDPQLPIEMYSLHIDNKVSMKGHDYKSITQGCATFIQLVKESNKNYSVPKLEIKDQPVHDYRAVLIDLARFWQPTEILYETIDLLWFYKIKYLQLHMTDHQRFTFPMEQFSKLKTVNENGQREYYTKEELQALVEYAKDRGITIIPEIELPGHSTALWDNYPEIFGITNKATGKAEQLYVINIAKEQAYDAIDLILEEVASVFYTSPFIHVGADEVNLQKITKAPTYQAYVKKHGLTEAAKGNVDELFCHFINRMNAIVKSKGKKMLVWEGFPNGGSGNISIDQDITVMAWNTTYNPPQNLIDHGYKIINATWIPWYLVGAMNFAPDTEQAKDWNIGKWEHWQPNYPKIQLTDTTNVLGGQLTFWEQTHEQVIPLLREYIPLLSEKLWSPQFGSQNGKKAKLKNLDLTYQKLFRPVSIQPKNLLNNKDHTIIDEGTISIVNLNNTTIRYTFQNDWNLRDLKDLHEYTEPIVVEKSGVISAQAFDEENKPIGYKAQAYFTKIRPSYRYKAYGHPPLKGWQTMPSSDTLTLIREGYIGKMNKERMAQINRKLFSKVESGHIDTRLHNQFNPYLLELSGTIKIPKTDEYSIELQTYDGLADIYLDDKRIVNGNNFKNEPEYFKVFLTKGEHKLRINYYFKNIRNRMSIKYKNDKMEKFEPIENLIKAYNL